MSLAEEPPLKRCSRGELREEEDQAGGWKAARRGGVSLLGSAQPREEVRDARSSFGFSEGVWEDSTGTGLKGAESGELGPAAGGGRVEEVVGRGFIAVLLEVVDKDRAD